MNHDKYVLLERDVLDGRPIQAISYFEPEADWDPGSALFASEPDQIGTIELMCISCALDEWPDIGQGFDLAKQHGEATRNGNTWSVDA